MSSFAHVPNFDFRFKPGSAVDTGAAAAAAVPNTEKYRGRDRLRQPIDSDSDSDSDRSRSRSRSREREQIECILGSTPDPSIISMINMALSYFNLPQLTQVPEVSTSTDGELDISIHAILLNSCHGGLPVIKTRNNTPPPDFKYDYKTIFARSKLRRLIKSPSTCCSYITPEKRRDYFLSVIQIISKGINKGDNYNNIIYAIKRELNRLSVDTKVEQNPCRTKSGSESICVNRKRAFEYVETPRGATIINKIFTTDEYYDDFETNPEHKLAPRGILFCNTVSITVNNGWFPVTFPKEYNDIIQNIRRGYEIGVYNKGFRSKGTIKYTTGTNLLSCPYFMFFASQRLGPDIITLNNSLSLGWDNTLLIPMVTRVTAEVLYWYFFNQPFSFIDMSCEKLCYRDETNPAGTGHMINDSDARDELRSLGYEGQLAALQNILQIGLYRLRGGNRKTRCNPKKYKRCNSKTKKCKTKKCKTKKYRTKKYKQYNTKKT
jgi:hypothetical protein